MSERHTGMQGSILSVLCFEEVRRLQLLPLLQVHSGVRFSSHSAAYCDSHSHELPDWAWKCAYNNQFDKTYLKSCTENSVDVCHS